MTSMRKRASQCQYPGTAIAALCSPDGHHNAAAWPEQLRLGSTGSPP